MNTKIATELLKIARSLVYRKLSFGIDEKLLQGAIEDTMVGIVERIRATYTYEFSWEGGDYAPTRWEEGESSFPMIEDDDFVIIQPKPMSIKNFVLMVIKNLKSRHRDIDISPERFVADRQLMAILKKELDDWRTAEDIPIEMYGKEEAWTNLVQKGPFIRGNKIVFNYQMEDSGMEELWEYMNEDWDRFYGG